MEPKLIEQRSRSKLNSSTYSNMQQDVLESLLKYTGKELMTTSQLSSLLLEQFQQFRILMESNMEYEEPSSNASSNSSKVEITKTTTNSTTVPLQKNLKFDFESIVDSSILYLVQRTVSFSPNEVTTTSTTNLNDKNSTTVMKQTSIPQSEEVTLKKTTKRIWEGNDNSSNKKPRNEQTTKTRPTKRWMTKYNLLKEFKEKNGTSVVPRNQSNELCQLAGWVSAQRHRRNIGALGKELIELLDNIGFIWNSEQKKKKEEGAESVKEQKAERLTAQSKAEINLQATYEEAWMKKYQELKDFQKQHGHTKVRRVDHPSLSNWIKHQRVMNSKGAIQSHRKVLLDQLGFAWNGKPEAKQKSDEGLASL